MSDFAFLDNMPSRIDRIAQRKKHTEDVRREFFKSKLSHIADHCEQAQDYCRDLMRSGADVSEELKELEAMGHSLVLVAMLLKREATNGKS